MGASRFFSLDYIERAVLQDGTPVRLRLLRPEDKDILRAGFERLSPESRYARFFAPKLALSEDELRYLCDVDHENHLAIGAVHDDGTDRRGSDGGGDATAEAAASAAKATADTAEAAEATANAPAGAAPEATDATADTAGGDDREGTGPAGAAASAPAIPVGLAVARFIRIHDPPNTAEAAIAVADEAQHKGLGKLLFLRLVAAAAERGVERFRCEVLGSNAGMAALLAQISPDRSIEVGGGMMSIEIALPNVTPTQPVGEPLQSPMYRLFRAVAQNAVDWTGVVRNLWRR